MKRFKSSFSLLLAMSLLETMAEPPPPVQAYRTLCDRTLQAVLETSSGTNIVDVFPVYLSGWIQATTAIPTLLDILEKPRGTNDVGSYHGYYHPMAVTTPMPPTPPTPAAGALSIGPISFTVLTNQLVSSEARTRRAELLVWVAAAKYGEEFQETIQCGIAEGSPFWTWVADSVSRFNPTPAPFRFRSFAARFPKEDINSYLGIFHSLRHTADVAEAAGQDDLFQQARDALQEIGHPYDEDPSLWPR